jgi:ubiquinone/menaquinone biosynthesis C-methylase UbiE
METHATVSEPGDRMVCAVRQAYDRAARAWAEGPALAYERLAAAAVAALPAPLTGALVLDVGAGTGTASRCIARAGGTPVAVDLALEMLVQARSGHLAALGRTLQVAGGDAVQLPFRSGCFDAAAACFCLSHLLDPVPALREVRRVLRPGGALVTATFRREDVPHPSKVLVDGAAVQFGFHYPAWYAGFKEREAQAARPEVLVAQAKAAGLGEVCMREVWVDTGVDTAEALVRLRLGMAYLAPFVDSLPADRRMALVQAACEALGPAPQPWRPAVLIVSSRAPA